MTGYFADHADRLTEHGYEVIPISRHDDQSMRWCSKTRAMVPVYTAPGKQPAAAGWQKGCPESMWGSFAGCGLGVLTRTTPAIDIDVMDADLSAAIQGVADRVLGTAPVRYGRAPKCLMPFNLRGDPFPKMKVLWRGIGDADHAPNSPPAVEVLTAGQQFVCLGVHPATEQPYRWERDPDLDIPRPLLPPMDQERAERFVQAVANALRKLGATEVKVSGVRAPVDNNNCRRRAVLRA